MVDCYNKDSLEVVWLCSTRSSVLACRYHLATRGPDPMEGTDAFDVPLPVVPAGEDSLLGCVCHRSSHSPEEAVPSLRSTHSKGKQKLECQGVRPVLERHNNNVILVFASSTASLDRCRALS